MPRSNEATIEDQDIDRRLDKARDLLDSQRHRGRYGAVSLLALIAAGVSATLLFTLVFGAEEAPAQAKPAPAAFELSSSALSAATPATEAPPKPAEPLLVGTEH